MKNYIDPYSLSPSFTWSEGYLFKEAPHEAMTLLCPFLTSSYQCVGQFSYFQEKPPPVPLKLYYWLLPYKGKKGGTVLCLDSL
jgi:hypothetical protein